MDNNMEDNIASKDEKGNTNVPQVKVMAHEGSDIKDNGKKRRKRKRSQKQIERWVKYREKKKLEKKNYVNTTTLSDHHIAATNDAPSIAVCSTLRADAPDFVPRSLPSTFDIKLPSVNIDDQEEREEDTPKQDVVNVHEIEIADANGTSDAIEEPECITTDTIHTDDDVFGIMTIYATSELHAVIDKEKMCKTIDVAEKFGYFYFSLSYL